MSSLHETLMFLFVADGASHMLYFGVKFYSADPCKLHEEITRYGRHGNIIFVAFFIRKHAYNLNTCVHRGRRNEHEFALSIENDVLPVVFAGTRSSSR